MSKLKNIKAVKEMLEGTHKTQTKTDVSFNDAQIVKREVGDTWTDENGNTWEQKKGYKVKVGKLSSLRKELKTFPNCRKETCTCTDPGAADLKMKAIHGMCLDCVTDMEAQLKYEGKYDEYERNKLLENGKAWLKNAEVEKEIVKKAISSQFVNENGEVEEWNGMTLEEVEQKIEEGFDKFRENFIKKLEEPSDETDIT